MDNQSIAKIAISKLREKGIDVSAGLSNDEISTIETILKLKLPQDLVDFLKEGVPVGDWDGAEFPNWHENPELIVARSFAYIQDQFDFDIENNNYWTDAFGEHPEDIGKAKEIAAATLRTWPPLFQIYGNRYMPIIPTDLAIPIISFGQPTDSVYYGNSLSEYLQNEFKIDIPFSKELQSAKVPFWDEALQLQ